MKYWDHNNQNDYTNMRWDLSLFHALNSQKKTAEILVTHDEERSLVKFNAHMTNERQEKKRKAANKSTWQRYENECTRKYHQKRERFSSLLFRSLHFSRCNLKSSTYFLKFFNEVLLLFYKLFEVVQQGEHNWWVWIYFIPLFLQKAEIQYTLNSLPLLNIFIHHDSWRDE